ncbi:SDR family NAD(P)-dependent oxidoreductase [Mycobacterium asiaticum]|uniref:SDR family NAD(P)-dependent oxidoreductase n=1 Tax=Mycobacterium asiaticum TaxID=1790 RepID=UPI00055DDED7|nr:SDR family oxidoreductase [Mycobacterium asiaticum]ORA14697.1 short-chain dehydrogenase [Mycobacterium asiaticum DSM 44297]
MNELDGTTAIVTGASRGFGRAIAKQLVAAGAHVVGIARNRAHLELVREELGDRFEVLAADAADPAVAGRLVAEYRPRTIVLAAGLAPRMAALADQTWDTFTENWNVDVSQAFHWVQCALRLPLAPGSSVIAISSGAAVNGSPLSGGYAGAKATVRFISSYAAQESARAGLGIDFVSLLPRLTPATDLGAKAVAAYAERQGVDIDAYLESFGPILTPEQVGRSVRDLLGKGAGKAADNDGAYLLTAAGIAPLR